MGNPSRVSCCLSIELGLPAPYPHPPLAQDALVHDAFARLSSRLEEGFVFGLEG